MGNWSRQTVNLDEDFVAEARERWEKMGFRSFTDYVETLMRADMAERPVLIRTEDGMVLASVLRKATPQEVKQAEEGRLRRSVGVVETDMNRHVVSVNEAFVRMCGHTLEDFRHKGLAEVLQGKDTEPESIEKIKLALQKREPVTVPITNYHADGRGYRVQLTIMPTATGFRGETRLLEAPAARPVEVKLPPVRAVAANRKAG